MSDENKNVFLVMGPPNTGKTAALRNLDLNKLAYINADNKEIPFKGQFRTNVPLKKATSLPAFIRKIEAEPTCEGAVLDTLTLAVDLYERQIVYPQGGTKDGQKAWADYGNFVNDVIHEIKTGTKTYFILAHEEKTFNEQQGAWNAKVPIKGAVGRRGVEAHFSIILCSMQIPVLQLEGYENDLLHITPREKATGIKYVFVTYVTSKYAGSMMRSPMGMWADNELYIDNDLKQVQTRVKQFYGTP